MKCIYFICLMVLLQSCSESSSKQSTVEESNQHSIPDDTVSGPISNIEFGVTSAHIPSTLDFCNEPVPLANPEFIERLDKELSVNTYWQSQTLLFIKKAHKWFPIIEPILKKHNIPDDFKYLAVIESGLENVVSPSGAKGFWQFMRPTALDYNLEVNKWVDERYDLEKSTIAACQYLISAHEIFDSWTLSAASYNMGKGGLSKRLEEQKTSSYYDLLLNIETARYVPRILAIKLILEHPEKYGFHIRKEEMYNLQEFKVLDIDTNINSLVDFAIQNGTTYRNLKILNPWLRSKSLPAKRSKVYQIKIPS